MGSLGGGAGYEDVRETLDKGVHSLPWPRTNLAVAVFKGHLCLSSESQRPQVRAERGNITG